MNKQKQYYRDIDELIHKHARPSIHRTPENEDTKFSYTTHLPYAMALIEDLQYQHNIVQANIAYIPYQTTLPWEVTITEKVGSLTKHTIVSDENLCVAICTAILGQKNIHLPEKPNRNV